MKAQTEISDRYVKTEQTIGYLNTCLIILLGVSTLI